MKTKKEKLDKIQKTLDEVLERLSRFEESTFILEKYRKEQDSIPYYTPYPYYWRPSYPEWWQQPVLTTSSSKDGYIEIKNL